MTSLEHRKRVLAHLEKQAMSDNGSAVTPAAPAAQVLAGLTPMAPGAGIATAISAVMSEIGVIGKDGRNEFHRYNYAKMEDVLQRLTPLMAKHGLVIFQTEIDRAMLDEDRAVAVRYAFTICHSSGEVWPDRPVQTGLSRCRDSKGGFDDKSFNKAHTAARKYFLLALFQIPTGDEDDADSGKTGNGSATVTTTTETETITDEQVDEMKKLLTATNSNLVVFLQRIKLESLTQIRADKFNDAMKLIRDNAKRREKTT